MGRWSAIWGRGRAGVATLEATLRPLKGRGTRWVRWLTNLLPAALTAYFVFAYAGDFESLVQYVDPGLLLLCPLAYAASLLCQYWVWSDLMGYSRNRWAESLDAYIRTNLMGKVPGGIWKLVGRATVFRPANVSAREVFVVAGVEMTLMLVADAMILLAVADAAPAVKFAGFAALLAITLAGARRVSAYLPRLTDRDFPWRWLLWLASLILAFLTGGAFIHLILQQFAGESTVAFATTLRMWGIAYAVGSFTQFLPVNSLLRDGSLAAMLATVVPAPVAVLAAVAVRLMLSLHEVLVGWACILAAGIARKSESVPPVAD